MALSNSGAGQLNPPTLYAITVLGYRKTGMSEEEYHTYISETHAGHLKALLEREGVVSYTMVSFPIPIPFPSPFPAFPKPQSALPTSHQKQQHNTRAVNEPLLRMVYGPHLPTNNIDDCDAVIQIVFRDIEGAFSSLAPFLLPSRALFSPEIANSYFVFYRLPARASRSPFRSRRRAGS